jgi:hypothetical protein
MTMRLDIVTNDAGEMVRRERSREMGAKVVVELYRLVKLTHMHDLGNAAIERQREQTYETIQEYCLRSGTHVSILFANKAVFVGGQLLRGSRAVYENAVELGAILERLGGSEVVIARELNRDDLVALAEAFSGVHRAGSTTGFSSPTPRFTLRRVRDAARLRGLELEELSDEQRIVRTYASAVVVLRRFFDDLEASRYVLPRRVKRVAQMLVDLSMGSTPAFLGVTEVRNANNDAAGRAVNTAILSVSAIRQVTSQRAVLVQVATAAMLFDVARPRALALAGSELGAAAELSEDQEDCLASGTAAVLTALGRINEPSVTRTVIAFEAQWSRREQWLGPVYGGVRAPTLHSRVVRIARRYNDLLTPEPGALPARPDHAIAVLAEELADPKDRTALRLLVASLGLVPVGSIVLLTNGQLGLVIGGGEPERPRVRVSMGRDGEVLAQPLIVDLAEEHELDVQKVLNTDGWAKGRIRTESDAFDEDVDVDVDLYDDGGSQSFERSQEGAAAPVLQDEEAVRPSVSVALSPASDPEGSSPSHVAAAFGFAMVERPRISVAARASGAEAEAEGGDDDEQRTMLVRSDLATRLRRTQEAAASGTLQHTPLAHILVYMLDHLLSGAIVFLEPTGMQHTVQFCDGVPSQVCLGYSSERLGLALTRLGLVDPAIVESAVAAARDAKLLLGEYLVRECGLTLRDLAAALEAQLTARVVALANLDPQTTYSYFSDADLLAQEGHPAHKRIVVSALRVILGVVRAWNDRARIGATLARLAKHPLVVHPECDIEGFALTAEEGQVLAQMRAAAPLLSELVAQAPAAAQTIASLIYVLSVTRQFSFKGQSKGPMAPRASWAASLPPAQVAEYQARAHPMETALTRGSRPSLRVSRTSPYSLVPGKDEAGVTEANAELEATLISQKRDGVSRPKIRKRGEPQPSVPDFIQSHEHERLPPAAFSSPPLPPSIPSHAMHLEDPIAVSSAIEAQTQQRLAEGALARGDFAAAEAHALKAAELEPLQPGYQLHKLYVASLRRPEEAARGIAFATSMLDRDPHDQNALLLRARLSWHQGLLTEALRDFRALTAAQPGHHEAEAAIKELRARKI